MYKRFLTLLFLVLSILPFFARNYKTEKLFGKKYTKIPILSSKLKGASYYLISGHGGPDPGAVGYCKGHELHEDEYAYDVVLRLAYKLMQHQAKVHLIIQDKKDGIRDNRFLENSERETCRGKRIPLDQLTRLRQRVNEVNKLARRDKAKYKRVVSIHVDSRTRKKELDVFFCYAPKSKKGKRWADEIAGVFKEKYDKYQPGRGYEGKVEARNLYVVKNTVPPALLVEIGNIQNQYNHKRILEYANREALAKWFCEAFINDFRKK